MRSMTAYARIAIPFFSSTLCVSLSSLNRRHLEIDIRAPLALHHLENDLRKRIAEKINRGKVTCIIESQALLETALPLTINEPLVMSGINSLRTLAAHAGFEASPRDIFQALIAIPDIITHTDAGVSNDESAPLIIDAVARAVEALVQGKEQEGAALQNAIKQHLAHLATTITEIEKRSADKGLHRYEKLEAALQKFTSAIGEPDKMRLLQECALLAERADCTEEICRFTIHLQRCNECLSDPVVGKMFEFLLTELLREINTIGSKTDDNEISLLVIDAKAEIEKIREQVQNVE